jgi:hypothetical protein
VFWNINEFGLLAASFAAFLLIVEAGYRLGRRRFNNSDELERNHFGALTAAVLGLLALLLGFTFAMSVSRFDTRKALILDEANAIGTTALRAKLLPSPYDKDAASLLRAYVAASVDFNAAGIDKNRADKASATASDLEAKLWALATTVAALDARSVPVGLFVQSLNDVIDVREKRRAALDNHVPEAVIYLLYAVSLVGLGLLAYGCGLGNKRHLKSNAVLALLIALVLTTILDIDRPRRGLIQVSQDSLVRLKAALDQDAR